MIKKYKMSCKCCKYIYWVIAEWYPWEICPVCGHSAHFDEFKDGEQDIKERHDRFG